MKLNEVKIGEVVKCVDNKGYSNLTLGKFYVVEGIDYAFSGFIIVKDDLGSNISCYPYRFSPVGNESNQDLYDVIYLDDDGEMCHYGYFKPMLYEEAVEHAEEVSKEFEREAYITKLVKKVETRETSITDM